MREWISKRCNVAGTLLVLAGSLLPTLAAADDAEREASTASLESLLSTPLHADYWYEAPGPAPAMHTSYTTRPTLAAVDFYDSSTIGRLKRIRELSLLTITDTGKSRFYLGVNDDGVFGVHLKFLSGREGDRFAEILRMPYLQATESPR